LLRSARLAPEENVSLGDVDVLLAVGGLLAGLLVGLTGMGGALVVTPMLVLAFGVPPAAAISSDVVAAAVMKPVGAWVHMRALTVHWKLVLWISVGSVPGVLIGTGLFAKLLVAPGAEEILRTLIGVVVLIALAAMLARRWVSLRAARTQQITHTHQGIDMPVRVAPTVLMGAVVGLLVGVTSVGSGSLVVTVLLLMYPLLRPSVLVGTDLTQAVPMLVAGAIAHAGFGEILLPVVVSLLLGQIPGVWIGARMSARYDGSALRWLLMAVLAATAAKLLGVPTVVASAIGIAGLALAAVAAVRERVSRVRG
jgi:uncharacterized membrane protein YfcA